MMPLRFRRYALILPPHYSRHITSLLNITTSHLRHCHYATLPPHTRSFSRHCHHCRHTATAMPLSLRMHAGFDGHTLTPPLSYFMFLRYAIMPLLLLAYARCRRHTLLFYADYASSPYYAIRCRHAMLAIRCHDAHMPCRAAIISPLLPFSHCYCCHTDYAI